MVFNPRHTIRYEDKSSPVIPRIHSAMRPEYFTDHEKEPISTGDSTRYSGELCAKENAPTITYEDTSSPVIHHIPSATRPEYFRKSKIWEHKSVFVIMQVVSSILIIVGLPSGFYLVFCMLDIIDQLKRASPEIGEGLMYGLQAGINETFLNDIAKQITHTVVVNAFIYPEPVLV